MALAWFFVTRVASEPKVWSNSGMIISAHRGANREALENTMAAFERAVDAGADRIELDVHLTRDREIVVHHDSVLYQRRRRFWITRHPWATLAPLRLRNGESIPLLRNVIARFIRTIELNIEIKGPSLHLAHAVGTIIRDLHIEHRVVVSSFHTLPLTHLAQEFPSIPRASLFQWMSSTSPFRLAALRRIRRRMERARSSIVHPEARMVTADWMAFARAEGWHVIPWFPMAGEERDRERRWTRLVDLDVDGIITNYPRELRAFLRPSAGRRKTAE